MAAVAVVTASTVVALVACHGGVIIIIMMALVLTIVRLLVVRIYTAFFPRVLARLVDLSASFVGAIKQRLIIAMFSLFVALMVPDEGLLMAAD